MKARDLMTTPAITIRDDDTLADAARLMLERHIGGLPVVDAEGSLVGFITESDFAAKERGVPFSLFRAPQVLGRWLGPDALERVYRSARDVRVRELMSRTVIAASEDDTIERVTELMMRHDINRVVIARGGKPVGIVARHDLLRMLVHPSSR